MNSAAILIVALCLVGQSLAFQVSVGACPKDADVVQGFEVDRYMGKWYEIERFSQLWELGGKCSTAEYTLEDGIVKVRNAMKSILGIKLTQEGTAELTNDEGLAKLKVTFDVPIVGRREAPYWVLSTDYDNYALVYSCSDLLGLLKLESAWILGRKSALDDVTKLAVEDAIEATNLKRSAFAATKQNC